MHGHHEVPQSPGLQLGESAASTGAQGRGSPERVCSTSFGLFIFPWNEITSVTSCIRNFKEPGFLLERLQCVRCQVAGIHLHMQKGYGS